MAKASRDKGMRIERAMVALHQDAGIACRKVSRTGHTGPDLRIADYWTGEVKACKDGAGSWGPAPDAWTHSDVPTASSGAG